RSIGWNVFWSHPPKWCSSSKAGNFSIRSNSMSLSFPWKTRPTWFLRRSFLLFLVASLVACAGVHIPNVGGVNVGGFMNQVTAGFEIARKLGKASEELTDEQQYYLGRSVAANILARYRPVRNEALTRY